MTTRRPTAATTRLAMYVRVSSEEQIKGYSLSAQERAIDSYAAQHGHHIVARYRDEGKSAKTDSIAKRPAFRQMLADAEAGRFDVVVVHKLDRFARNLQVQLGAYDRLGKAGVGFVSLNENLDYTTPMGRMILSQLGSVNQFYSENLALEVKKGKGERKSQGLHNGLLPFGVTKGENRTLILDTVHRFCDVTTRTETSPGEGLVIAFQLAAAGKTDKEIARALNAAGYRTSGNRGRNPFQKDSVRVFLQNRFYVGDLPDGLGGWVPGKHGALIDVDLFDAAQKTRQAYVRRPNRVAAGASPWGLSGVATCACGGTLRAYGRTGGKRRVQCASRTETGECDEPTFMAEIVETQIGALLGRFIVPATDRKRLVSEWKRSQGRAGDSAGDRLRIARRLDRLKDLYLEGDLERDSYQAQKAELQYELALLPDDGAADIDVGNRLAGFLGDVASAWTLATPEERNRLARQLFADVIVENRTAVAVTPRPALRPFFETLALPVGCQAPFEVTRWRKRRDSNPRSQP